MYNSICFSTQHNLVFKHFDSRPGNPAPLSSFSTSFPPAIPQPKADTNSTSIHCLVWAVYIN